MISCYRQDCVCLIAPYPYNPNQPESIEIARDFDMDGGGLLWYGRLQLLFRCTLCRAGRVNDTRCHTEVSLAFPHQFGRTGRCGHGAADTRHNAGNGSRLYELNVWMWRYGLGQARKVSVVEAMEARVKRLREARARAGETVKRRRLAAVSRAAEAEEAAQ